MMKRTVHILLLLVLAIACNESFDAPPKALLEVSLVNVDTLDTSSPLITVYGVGLDSIWIDSIETNTFRLQLGTELSSSFVLLLDSIADTLTIFHENELIFESAESGFYYQYKIQDIEHTFYRIDDYEITDSLVTKNWHENIQLYINPLPADDN
jgi:hypothetical protein